MTTRIGLELNGMARPPYFSPARAIAAMQVDLVRIPLFYRDASGAIADTARMLRSRNAKAIWTVTPELHAMGNVLTTIRVIGRDAGDVTEAVEIGDRPWQVSEPGQFRREATRTLEAAVEEGLRAYIGLGLVADGGGWNWFHRLHREADTTFWSQAKAVGVQPAEHSRILAFMWRSMAADIQRRTGLPAAVTRCAWPPYRSATWFERLFLRQPASVPNRTRTEQTIDAYHLARAAGSPVFIVGRDAGEPLACYHLGERDLWRRLRRAAAPTC